MKRQNCIHRIARSVCALLSLCALFLAGCASAPQPLSPETSALEKYWSAAGIQYPASAPLAEKPAWEAGQYVMTGTMERGKLTTLTRTLIAGTENNGWIIEIDSSDKWGKGYGIQFLIISLEDAVASRDPSKMQIGWVKLQDAKNKVTKLEGKLIEPYMKYANELCKTLTIANGDVTSGGTVTVPAGIFAGSFRQKTMITIAGVRTSSDNWYHSAIPVNGLIKSWSNNEKTVTELLSFGTDGKAMIK